MRDIPDFLMLSAPSVSGAMEPQPLEARSNLPLFLAKVPSVPCVILMQAALKSKTTPQTTCLAAYLQ